MTKDYYKILGITEFESQDAIKNAYRKLARKWHPDIAGNSEDVIIRFKEINEAYEILSNKIKKEEYDRARRFYSYATSNENKFKSEPPKEEKKSFAFSGFNWKKAEQKPIPKRGEDIYSDIELSVFEAAAGTTKTVNMLQTQLCPKCGGRKFINGSICKACNGKGEFTNYKKFTVKIPAGIKDKSKIRLAGEGSAGINGGVNGDMYITVHIQEPKTYKTDGLNILKTIPITPYEAVLGAEIKICTIKGCISVKINPNTQNGQKIRLAGCGIVQNNKVGDMIVTVEIKIPKQLSDEEISLYKKLAEISTENIRNHLYEN